MTREISGGVWSATPTPLVADGRGEIAAGVQPDFFLDARAARLRVLYRELRRLVTEAVSGADRLGCEANLARRATG